MNDRRVNAIRNALEALIESVDATSRIARWGQQDPVPDSLRQAAERLEANRKTANGLTLDNAIGTPAIVHRLSALTGAVRSLSAAYDEFLGRKLDPTINISVALENLDAEIDNANETLQGLE
jgi:hypothetical protein